MSLLKFAEEAEARRAPRAGSSVRTVARATARTEDLPQAKVWVNIGLEVNGRFVNLPNGLPLDTMQEVLIRGNNKDWNAFQTSRNSLYHELMAAADKLEPGAEMEVPLKVRVRRIADPAAILDVDNAYHTDFAGLLGESTIIPPAAPKEESEQQ